MATFKATVRTIRTDKTYLVYIRVTHNRKIEYIKTDMYVHANKVKLIDGKNEITDQIVLGRWAIQITEYLKKLNFEDTENWTVKDVVKFITCGNSKIPFIPFCNEYIKKIRMQGRDKMAENYENALKSFINHFGKNITFQEIKTKELNSWIKTLMDTARAKEMYPSLIKTMFNSGVDEFNDYDNNRIRIANQPFKTLIIPKSDVAIKKGVDVKDIRAIFKVKPDTYRSELAQDVAKLILYLVGINTVDLFYLKKDNYMNGKICYNRKKTKG